MGPLEFVKDRTIILSLVLGYTGWKETYGQVHWKILTTRFTDFQLLLFTYPVVLLVYFIFSLIFAYIDFFVAPDGGISGVRLQPKKDHTWMQYKKAIPLVLFNLLVMSPILTVGSIYLIFPVSPYHTDQPSGMYPSLPSTFMVLRDLLLSMILRDMIFYYLHRLFHHPSVYATFHKKHHEFTAPIAVSALYADPVDFALTNLAPLLVGPLLLNSHPVTMWFYFAEAIIETVSVHSGYNWPGFPCADMHDFHHETFNSMFSLLGLGDYIHGTDTKFSLRMEKKEKTT